MPTTRESGTPQSAPVGGATTAPAGADGAEFGPRGYLPQKAASRARKIVLRAPMGLQWPAAAVATAVLLAAVGAVYLATIGGAPQTPYVAAGALDAVDPRGAAVWSLSGATPSGQTTDAAVVEVLVVRAGGGLAAFAAPVGGASWCPDSRRLEAADRVWTAEGRLVGGDGASLRALPAQVHEGTVYVDPTAPGRAFPPALRGETPVCT